MKRIYLSLLLVVLCLSLVSCGEYGLLQKTPDYEYKYEAAKAYLAEGKYSKSATLFYDLLSVMKGTANGEESLFLTAMSEFYGKHYDMAHNDFQKYIKAYPKGIYIEPAYYHSALSLYHQTPDPRLDQTSTIEAMGEFQAFLDRYPYSSLKEQTQEMVFSLHERLSILVLRAKYQLAVKSIEDKRVERYRDAIDEYYAFENDFPESKYMKEAKEILQHSEKFVKRKGIDED